MTFVYDELIVGAGSSGAVLAAHLSEDPDRSVLLLEAGPDYAAVGEIPPDVSRIYSGSEAPGWRGYDWGLTARATADREVPYPRGMLVGGSSAINGAVALRGVPADYDEWAGLGNDRWSWSEVLPYFIKLESDRDVTGPYHGHAGPIPIGRFPKEDLTPVARAFLQAATDLGVPETDDFNHPESTGAGVWPLNQVDGVRISTDMAYLQPARRRTNLTIQGECLVDRVIFDGRRAVGVQASVDGQPRRFSARRVTLAAGSIGSPAILMRSGIGPGSDLQRLGIDVKAALPGVGANLIDHPRSHVFFQPEASVTHLQSPVFESGIRCTASGSDEVNDLQVCPFVPLDARAWGLPTDTGAAVQGHLFAALQRPDSRGRLSLASADPEAPPVIDLNYLAHPRDTSRIMDGLRLGRRLLNASAFAPYVRRLLPHPANGTVADTSLMTSDRALETYVRQTVTTIYHPVGTARMGPDDDELAVVDQRGRVRGFDNLLVLDASIMPTIPRANTNLTCIMIAERAADWMS